MRERDELRYINRYKFALIRIRFPDGVYLQGTFSVYEKLDQVYEFVQSCLKNESIDFKLMSPIGGKFDDNDLNKTLHDLRWAKSMSPNQSNLIRIFYPLSGSGSSRILFLHSQQPNQRKQLVATTWKKTFWCSFNPCKVNLSDFIIYSFLL